MDCYVWSCGKMSFDFKKFYDVGTHLKDYPSAEEYQRSSISRYYYSVFHPLKEYYENSFRRVLSSQDSHKTLIEELENSPFKEEKILGEKMRNLRNNRNYADYNKKELRKIKVRDSKDKADEILSQLNYLIKHPLRIMKK